jgi:Mrp family chromosome partitioning ATPase
VIAERTGNRHLSAVAVNAAVRSLSQTKLKTKTESMLRVFLCFSAIHRRGLDGELDTGAIRDVVRDHFVLLPTPAGVNESKYDGTIGLRTGPGGNPYWLRNDSYRGSFLDYAGPNRPGRKLFEGDDWHNPLRDDAVDLVVATHGEKSYKWPATDALAAILLANRDLEPALGWAEIVELARKTMGIAPESWAKITSEPIQEESPFDDEPWEASKLAAELRPAGLEDAEEAEEMLAELPEHLGSEVERVRVALRDHGARAIVALAGVPGTSKSHTARQAARLHASEGCLREIQFSPGYTYEEFMEGPRYGKQMEVEIEKGVFLDLNEQAILHSDRQYVLLIEELTRADIPRVFGELLTYVEYRGEDDTFTTIYDRKKETRIASNLAILATYNPTDSSAVNVDSALLRRMRILDFPPSVDLLAEILADNGVDERVIGQLQAMFEACREMVGADRFAERMPFGHAVFASVTQEADLYPLWHEELVRMLVRPHTPPHELYETIVEHYPWQERPGFRLPS